ncbi:TonB-dependent receptor family protein [Jejudonia soesokkakensis]|uniref:TonB-dependent receptor family protein n=1 Tax=Jejudonia soesokkakensis TaxID=1323432 RepID=A0ABW2MUP2_9FLAO
MKLRLKLTVFLLVFSSIGFSQNISGTIYSEINIPIVNAELFYAEKLVSTTNSDGFFSFHLNSKLPITVLLKHPKFSSETFIITKEEDFYILKQSQNLEPLEEVFLTSEKFKQSDVLIPTTEVSEEIIKTYSPVDLVAAVNTTPGVYIQSGAINTNRITIRGVGSRTLFGTNKIRGYFNGIPITNGVGETSIDRYNPEDLESLEIVKGPKATLYGTNLGGTLLLTSKELRNNSAKISNNTTVGSYGLLKNSTRLGFREENLTLHFNYDHLQLDGYRDNNQYNRNTYLFNASYALSEKNKLDILLNHTNNFAQIASSLGETAFNEDPTQAAFTWDQAKGFENNRETLVGLSLTSLLSETFTNKTSVYYTYLDHYEPRPFNILDEITHGYGARTVFSKELLLNERKTSIDVGTEVYQDHYRWQTIDNLYEQNDGEGSLEGELLSNNKEKRSQINVFASLRTSISEKIELQVGVNTNKTQYTYDDHFNKGTADTSAERDFDIIIAPTLNALYQFSENTTIFLNISRGFNYPGLEETLTPEGVINPDIGPETGWNYEVGSSLSLFRNSLRIKAAAYLLSIDDLVVAERIGNDQFIGRNAGKTHHRGLEASLTYDLTFSEKLLLSAFINTEFNFHKFIDFVDEEEDFSGNELPGVPDKKVTTGIRLKHSKGFYILSNFQYIGSQPITDENDLYASSYELLNIKGGYDFEVGNQIKVSFSAGINNVLDKTYASSILINASGFGGNEPRYFYPGLPRNYFASLGIHYSL